MIPLPGGRNLHHQRLRRKGTDLPEHHGTRKGASDAQQPTDSSRGGYQASSSSTTTAAFNTTAELMMSGPFGEGCRGTVYGRIETPDDAELRASQRPKTSVCSALTRT